MFRKLAPAPIIPPVVPRVEYANAKFGMYFDDKPKHDIREGTEAYYIGFGDAELRNERPEMVLTRKLLAENTPTVERAIVHELGHWARDLTGINPRPPGWITRLFEQRLRSAYKTVRQRQEYFQDGAHSYLEGIIEAYLYTGEF